MLYFEIIDSLSNMLESRFDSVDHLECFVLLNETLFINYADNFPSNALQNLSNFYPGIFNFDSLKSQLITIYEDKQFHIPPRDLLKHIHKYQLFGVLDELTKLLELYLTIPVTTVEAERSFSALKRIKTYSRNTLSQENLSMCAFISIEKNIIDTLKLEGTYYDKVMAEFIGLKNRRADFVYKDV